MFKFGATSIKYLNFVDKRLKILAEKVLSISPIDFLITEGLRTKEKQEQLYKTGKSKTLKSKHLEGKAIDIIGHKEQYKTSKDIYILIGLFIAVAKQLNINIRVGALWNTNSTIDNNFIDAYHIELKD